LESWPRYACWP